MAQRIVWDEYETALLIDTFWQIEKTPNRKQELIKGLSDALRQKAVNSGLTIDEKFRNVNGITMQLSPIAHAFFPERPSLTSSVMFNSMVELYKTDREAFNKTLAIAKSMVVADNYVADRFVSFNVDEIDSVLSGIIANHFCAIRDVTTFALFPICGYPWNSFLLESYCYKYSKKYSLRLLNFNDKNAGKKALCKSKGN